MSFIITTGKKSGLRVLVNLSGVNSVEELPEGVLFNFSNGASYTSSEPLDKLIDEVETISW